MKITNSLQFDYRNPQIKVKFTTVEGAVFEVTNQEIEGDILSLKTVKNIKNIAGTFEIKVIGRKDFKQVYSSRGGNNFPAGELPPYKIFKPAGLVDISINGTTIMTTNKLSIDATEKTSTTAATG